MSSTAFNKDNKNDLEYYVRLFEHWDKSYWNAFYVFVVIEVGLLATISQIHSIIQDNIWGIRFLFSLFATTITFSWLFILNRKITFIQGAESQIKKYLKTMYNAIDLKQKRFISSTSSSLLTKTILPILFLSFWIPSGIYFFMKILNIKASSLSSVYGEFIGSFLGFLFALVIFGLGLLFSKLRRDRLYRELQKNLLLMIKDEIKFNNEKVEQIKGFTPKNILPTFRLKTDNKDSCWPKIIEYRHEESDLIENVSRLYYKYDILNRTIDFGFQFITQNKHVTDSLMEEIKRICEVIKENSERLLEQISAISL